MADARLTGGIKSDGQPPNSQFNGCFLVRRDGVAFYTILVLLVLELGNNFIVRATTHVLKPLPATVIVTIRGGFRNRTSTQLTTVVRLRTHPPNFSAFRCPPAEGSIPRL